MVSVLRVRARPWFGIVCGIGWTLVAASILLGADAQAGKKKQRSGTPRASSQVAPNASKPSRSSQGVARGDAGVVSSGTPDSGLVCLYGRVFDAHRGSDRCLAPEEMDPPLTVIADTRLAAEQLGMFHGPEPETSDLQGADSGIDIDADARSEAADGSAVTSYRARIVSVAFENGVVARAQRALERAADEMAECVLTQGGLKMPSARLKVMFLVRARGRAEGIIVASARNIPPRVVRCITTLIETEPVGPPSNDPVGVTALIELKERQEGSDDGG